MKNKSGHGMETVTKQPRGDGPRDFLDKECENWGVDEWRQKKKP